MSNEHEAPRNDDPPRTDDGRPVHDAPRIDDGSGYGDQRTGTAGEPPRYGERITSGSSDTADAPTQAWDRDADGDRRTDTAADSTPTQAYAARDDSERGGQWSDQRDGQYGQQQYGSDRRDGEYGQQQQYGDRRDGDQHGQQWQHGHDGQHGSAAPVYGQPNDGSWQSYDEQKPVKKKKTVGVVAFVVALLALVAGIVSGYLFGHAFGDNSALREAIQNNSSGTLSQSEQEQLQRDIMNDPAVAGQIAGAGILFVIGTVLGLWAIVQGIIAAVTKRGRAFGVLAIVIAVVAVVVFAVVAGSTVTAAFSGMM